MAICSLNSEGAKMLSGAIPRIQLPPVPKINLALPEALRSYPLTPILVLTGLFVAAVIPAIYLGWNNTGVFNTPDENSAYMTARFFAKDTRLYFQDSFTEMNPESPSGPRGFVQHNGRSVPIYPLGHPLLLGIVHKITGNAAPVVLAVIPGLIIVSLALLLRIINPGTPAYLGFAFLGVLPVWYWTSRVYMNVSLTILFISLGILCFALAIRKKSLLWVSLASSALALAALVRYNEAPLLLIIGIAFMTAFIRLNEHFRWKSLLLPLLAYAAPQVALFLLPTGILNWATYGSPFEVGYIVFFEHQFPDRLQESGGIIQSAFKVLRLAFFPSPFDFNVTLGGIKNQILLLFPFGTTFGLLGIFMARKPLLRVFGYAGISILGIAIVYVLVSRADPGTFMAFAEEPDLRASIIRYWMPIYLVLGIGTAYALSKTSRAIALAVLIPVVGISAYQLWIQSPESIRRLDTIIADRSSIYSTILEEYTEPDAVVFSGTGLDKWVTPVRRTVGIWQDSVDESLLRQIADSAAMLNRNGTPVYFLMGPYEPGDSMSSIKQYVADDHLNVELLTRPVSNSELWRLVSVPHTLEFKDEGFNTYKTDIVSPGNGFILEILQDGSSINHVSNPSFETGLDGWKGPNNGVHVTRDSDNSVFGDSSMRMELQNATFSGELVRSTYTVSLQDLQASHGLAAIVRVFVPQIHDARALMRTFVKDENDVTIDKNEASIFEVTTGFNTLMLDIKPLPEGTATISLQLGIEAVNVGGNGVVFWDNAELIAKDQQARDDCRGVLIECSQLCRPDASYMEMDDSISSFVLSSVRNGNTLLCGPFQTFDKLEFRENSIYLSRPGFAASRIATYLTPALGETISISAESNTSPAISIVPVNQGKMNE
jgi:hypothetical protein